MAEVRFSSPYFYLLDFPTHRISVSNLFHSFMDIEAFASVHRLALKKTLPMANLKFSNQSSPPPILLTIARANHARFVYFRQ